MAAYLCVHAHVYVCVCVCVCVCVWMSGREYVGKGYTLVDIAIEYRTVPYRIVNTVPVYEYRILFF